MMKTGIFVGVGTLLVMAATSGCIKMDSFMFDGDPAELADYDFTSEALNGIPPERITSELVQGPNSSEGVHIIYIERDVTELDPRLDPEDNITVVLSHGNRGNIFLYWYRAAYFEDMGFNVLIYDYRGYGASEGETTEAKLYEDAELAYDEAKRRGAGAVFSAGYSMGGGPAIWLCSPEGGRVVAGCFTESAFTGAERLINAGSGYDFPSKFFVDFEIDNETRIATVEVPFLLMHGTDDQRVGFEHAQILWAAVKDTHPLNRFYPVEGAGHRNVPVPSYPGEDEPLQYSHPDELPPDLHEEFQIYKGRIVDFVVDAMDALR